MATTATQIASATGLQPFYVLKISGLPYIFTATVNPYSSAHGASAWTTPSGMTVVPGMHLPNDRMTQKMPDLLGGICSSERLRVQIPDVPAWDSNGKYELMGRLTATGRAMNTSTVRKGYLEADLGAADISGLQARAVGTAYASSGNVYVGIETVAYTGTVVASGVTTFQGLTRRKFPCVDNFGSITWPPVPYYRAQLRADGAVLPSANVPVTSEPLMFIGRQVALYVGHVLPGGKPEAESSALLRFVGRVRGLKYSGPMFSLELEGILSELQDDELGGSRVAHGLASATIAPNQIHLYGRWRSFVVATAVDFTGVRVSSTEQVITVAEGLYSGPLAVAQAVSAALATANVAAICTFLKLQTGEIRWGFRMLTPSSQQNAIIYVRHGSAAATYEAPGTGGPSLLTVLGFPPSTDQFAPAQSSSLEVGSSSGDVLVICGSEPAAGVFIPFDVGASSAVQLIGSDAPGSRFFTAQEANDDVGWVRLSDGQIVEVTAQTASTVTLRDRLDTALLRRSGQGQASTFPYYALALGSGGGSIEQVLIAPTPRLNGSSTNGVVILGRLLASSWDYATGSDLDVYPEGVGLGLASLITENDWFSVVDPVTQRMFVIDNKTTFGELFTPIAKELGLLLVWDPSTGRIRLRKLQIPQSSSASSFSFTESNRARPNEVTDEEEDFTNVRTGFTVRWGWDSGERKFLERDVTVISAWASNYLGGGVKLEKIEDRTIRGGEGSGPAPVFESLKMREQFYIAPWKRLSRRVNRTGLVLSPGTVHLVVDNTIHHPTTGRLGFTAGDEIYGVLTEVSTNLATGEADVEILVQQRFPEDTKGQWATCGLVDFTANSSGFTNGWAAGTKTLRMTVRFSSDGTSYDGIDFDVGDTVSVATYDNDGAPTVVTDTIASITSDGLDVTLTTGGHSISASVETWIYQRKYTSATAARQASEAWLGDYSDGLIQATGGNKKWS